MSNALEIRVTELEKRIGVLEGHLFKSKFHHWEISNVRKSFVRCSHCRVEVTQERASLDPFEPCRGSS